MRSWLVLSAAIALTSPGAASGGRLGAAPDLRSTATSKGHIVVVFSPGELLPGEIAVATRATRIANGRFLRANVRLLERITATTDPETGIVRFRTHGTVPRGLYYVAVSGFMQEPPPSCIPIASRCNERWSVVRRVVVRPIR